MRLIQTVVVFFGACLVTTETVFLGLADPDTILAATALLVSARSDASNFPDPTAGLLSDFPNLCSSSCSVFNDVMRVSGIVHSHEPRGQREVSTRATLTTDYVLPLSGLRRAGQEWI